MSEEKNNMNSKDVMIGLLIGGIIGAGTALLFAPKSGRELRTDISNGYQTASKKTQDFAKTVGEQTDIVVDKIKDAAGHMKEDVNRWKSSAEERVSDLKESVEDTLERVKGEASAAVDAAQGSIEEAKQQIGEIEGDGNTSESRQ